MESPLDRIDVALITLLQNDGRLSNKELAASVGLAPSSTHGRLKRLFDRGIIRRVRAEVDPQALGIHLEALVFVALHSQGPDAMVDVWDLVGSMKEVRVAYQVGGEDDLLLHVCATDPRHLQTSVLEPLSRSVYVRKVRTELIFGRDSHPLPCFLPVCDPTSGKTR